jgi:hypothetical protein
MLYLPYKELLQLLSTEEKELCFDQYNRRPGLNKLRAKA